MVPTADDAARIGASAAKSASAHGFIAVLETGKFCRPGCPELHGAAGRAFGSARDALAAGSDGELTGYGGGLPRKRYLLALEQSEAFSLA